MKLSPQQSTALQKIQQWLSTPPDDRSPVFRLFGPAGTGKTSSIQHFVESSDMERVLYAAYTGKAASVMRRSGCTGASTIHRLIYKTRDKSKARLLELKRSLHELEQLGEQDSPEARELRRMLKQETENVQSPVFTLDPASPVRDADLVVIDEASMVDKQMAMDLVSFGVPILVLGDDFQLPPVKGAGAFMRKEPDFRLTEIHRQAKDSPIIQLATTVREGGTLKPGQYGESLVIAAGERPDPDAVLKHDQVLVGTNESRRFTNKRIRELRGFASPRPMAGDRVVCLKNNHDLGLLNGEIWHVEQSFAEYEDLNHQSDRDPFGITIVPDDERDAEPLLIEVHAEPFYGEEIDSFDYRDKDRQVFDYGYGLTVHKAQGSQWDSVLIFDESAVFRSNRRRWLYTGVTRAAERVTVCLR